MYDYSTYILNLKNW